MRQYEQEKNLKKPNFFHLDLYRLEGNIEKEVENLGLFDIWKDNKNVVAIEWAEKIENILPQNTKFIRIENLEEDKRKISII
jgi:tRNA threonylcarbamoyladenosine biosynthesis protein TsaE